MECSAMFLSPKLNTGMVCENVCMSAEAYFSVNFGDCFDFLIPLGVVGRRGENHQQNQIKETTNHTSACFFRWGKMINFNPLWTSE